MLAAALVGHLVGDYLLQNDYLAMNKKKSSMVCLIHCLLWTMSVCLLSGLGYLSFLALLTTHFVQDRTNVINWWMDLVGQRSFRTGPLSPWSIIVVDNTWHMLTIYVVVRWLHPIDLQMFG